MEPEVRHDIRPIAESGESLESLMDRASEALVAGRYIESEKLADEALHRAWKRGLYEMVARITLPLQEARRQRRLAAVESGELFVVEENDVIPGSDGGVVKCGCYVVMPSNVAADARQIRMNALEQGVAVVTLAREPITQSGLMPMAVIGPCTVRVRMKPVKEMTPEWCLKVIEALTEEAFLLIDRTRPVSKQVDFLMDYLDALPESEELHQDLAATARKVGHS